MSKTYLTGPAPEPTVYLFEDNGMVYAYDSLQKLADVLGRWGTVSPHFRTYSWDSQFNRLCEHHHRFIARQGGDIIEDETLKALLPPYQSWFDRRIMGRTQSEHLKRKAPVPFTRKRKNHYPVRPIRKHQMLKELSFKEENLPHIRVKIKNRYRYDLDNSRSLEKNWKKFRKHQWKEK